MIKNKLNILLISFFCLILSLGVYHQTKKVENSLDNCGTLSNELPPSIRMYHYINKYSDKYNIPKDIAFGIAHEETGYCGPFDWSYNPKQTSFASAYGAMQIQVPTANYFSNKYITKNDLLNNLELNVQLSMKILAHLKKQYGSWHLALGAYNTGRPIINAYATQIVNFNGNIYFKNNYQTIN